jgi:hypothetical protein
MNKFVSSLLRVALVSSAALASGSALADGFSVTLETPVTFNPTTFSAGGSLNYSLEVIPNLFVGASAGGVYNFSAGAGALGVRVAGIYVAQLLDAPNTFVNAYVGAGTNVLVVPGPVSFGVDANAGFFARYGLSPAVRIYGGADGEVAYNFGSGSFIPAVSGYAGARFEAIPNLSLYLQGGVGYNSIKAANASGSSLTALPFGNSGLVYDLRAGLYYAFAPQVQLGFYSAYNGGFTIGLTAKFLEKPGTLGIAGNYLP